MKRDDFEKLHPSSSLLFVDRAVGLNFGLSVIHKRSFAQTLKPKPLIVFLLDKPTT